MEPGPSTRTDAEGLREAIPAIYVRPKREGSTVPRTTRDIHSETVDFYTACLPIEVRLDDSSDPFLDPLDYNDHLRATVGPYTFAWYDDTREATRSALAAQARELMHRQQRVCVLQLVLCGRHARLLRWDRGGAVATERFEYAAAPGVLAEFLWRYAHLSAAARGWDDTAGPASAHETRLFRTAVRCFLKAHSGRARAVPEAEVTLDASFPVWRVRVVDEHSGAATVLIVQRPFHHSGGVLGRATRAYLAYDVRTRRVVFVKDTWRAAYTRRLGAEAGTYRTLREHGVPHLPNVLYACDVRDGGGELQQTRSYGIAHMNRAWDQRTERGGELVHHRVVQEIAYPLQQALNEREYVQALHDAAIGESSIPKPRHAMLMLFPVAVGSAHAQANLLHRDLSLNNIMITSEGRGVLNDWDMAGRDAASIYVVSAPPSLVQTIYLTHAGHLDIHVYRDTPEPQEATRRARRLRVPVLDSPIRYHDKISCAGGGAHHGYLRRDGAGRGQQALDRRDEETGLGPGIQGEGHPMHLRTSATACGGHGHRLATILPATS